VQIRVQQGINSELITEVTVFALTPYHLKTLCAVLLLKRFSGQRRGYDVDAGIHRSMEVKQQSSQTTNALHVFTSESASARTFYLLKNLLHSIHVQHVPYSNYVPQ